MWPFDTFNWKRLVHFARLVLYRMVKRVRRVLGGQTEIERICGGARNSTAVEHTQQMTHAFWKEWSTSKKLEHIYKERGTQSDMDVTATAKDILSVKHVSPRSIVETNIHRCLKDIRCVNGFTAHVKSLAAQSYDSKNPTHEMKLETLWKLLLPNQEREGGRITREWGAIGFQQSDPASDFRGGGILSLDQLIFIASTRQSLAQRMIKEPGESTARYPWACVGINLTIEAISLLESHAIRESLYGKSNEEAMKVFNSLYADMFEIVHAKWVQANPSNILDFPRVKSEAMDQIRKELSTTGALVPPGSSA